MASSSARTARKTLVQQKKRADSNRDLEDQNILVKDANIWTGNGFTRGSILIEKGRIRKIAGRIDDMSLPSIDASGLWALPGLIDVHVHLRDMGLAYKEDFASGTAAAAAGGFTTVLDMPNTLPPTDSAKRLAEKQREASKKARVNIGFHAAATSDSKTIRALARGGAFSLKLYMPKPVAPFDVADDQEIHKMMNDAREARIPVTVHAEEIAPHKETHTLDSFHELADARSPVFETRAVERIATIQRQARCRVHLCHLTVESSLQRIAVASSSITTEVTPHHLLLSKRVLKKLGWKAWMVPPLRSEAKRQHLLSATCSGSSDVVASDHAPHTIEEKEQQPGNSPPGVPGLETTLPLMLTLVNKGRLSISRLVKLLAENPARIFGLRSKVRLRSGYDGDVVLVDLKRKSRIDSCKFFSKAKFSPFDGFETKGAVISTIVGGRLVYHEGEVVGREGFGSVLRGSFSS
jgi:dihydroorotase